MHRALATVVGCSRTIRPFLLLGAAFVIAVAVTPSVDGKGERIVRRPELVGPFEGEVVSEAGLRFSFVPPPNTTRQFLLVSSEPFSTDGLAALPTGDAIRVVPVTKPVVDGASLGITAREAGWYWAVASDDGDGGSFAASPVRRVEVRPAWQVSDIGSPLVRRETRGRLAPADTRGRDRNLHLAAGYDFDPTVAEPALAPHQKSGIPVKPDERVGVIVQFAGTPTPDDLATLQAAGAVPVTPLAGDAWLVRAYPESRAALARASRVSWTGDWHPAYRVAPALKVKAEGNAAAAAEAVEMTVLLFNDAPVGRDRQRLVNLGATITAESDNGINRLVRVRMPAARALDAARLPGVHWVEPWIAPTFGNSNAQWVVQTNVNNNRKVWDQGIDGTGQVVHNSDSGITVGHNQFRDPAVPITTFGDFPTHRKIIAYHLGSNNPAITFGDHSGASFHGTHTNGTVAGDDAPVGGADLRDGMAKGAKIFFHDISGTTLANSIDHFPDLNDLYQDAYNGNAGGAPRLSTNSWGSNNGGAYDVSCMQVDQFMWAHKDFLIFFSNGNAGAVNTVGSPASAKSICSAGGTQNGTSASNIYASTSRGPTDDNRRKPTVCSPGQSIQSADGNTTTGYKSLSGTSMASPSQTGAAVLMRQYLTQGWYPTGAPVPANGFTPSAALMKAMVVNSADNGVTGFTAPDNNVGYGRVMADNVLYFPGDSKRLIAIDHQPGLQNGDYIEYEIQVTSNSFPLEVTLCWTDYPASPASSIQLVNDLNLTVSRGASVYKGNVYASGASITGGSFDARNVEEACLISNPALGTWTVRVEGFAVPVGPQPFGLVVTGVVDGGSGALYLDRAEYGSTGTVGVKVIDTNATSPITVHVSSPSEPAGEDVTLTGSNGVLTGTLTLAPWSPGAPHGAGHLASFGRDGLGTRGVDVADDTLRVAHGDQLTATYLDASPAATLTARALVAIEQPTITGVTADSRGSSAAVINWTTNLNADSRVYYGLTPALELGSVFQADQVLAHQMLIPGLTTNATYYYDVESIGPNGNLVRDDNGGQHYRVTIDSPADILLVVGDEASFDRLETWTEAAAAAGWSLDIWSGTLADNAQLGDTTGGLRSYKAVIWQPGFNQYPPFSDTQRTTVGNYLSGGGRLLAVGHDIAWAFGDVSSPVYSIARRDWLRDVLHTTWQEDPATWSSNIGYAADPISGAYTGGVPYTPLGSAQAGDEVDVFLGNGTSNYVWRSNATTPDDIGFRWISNVNNGSPDSAVWGGAPSRLATMYFEYTALTPPFGTPNATRTDILDKTLIWLIGRDQPAIAVTAPAVAATVTTDSVDVTWTEVISGASAANRRLEYSADGGDSWTLIANGVGPSPYRWGLDALPNRTAMRVRVTVTDNGTPALTGSGAMTGNFSLQRPSADTDGPVVVPGSPAAAPNPYTAGMAATLAARVTDAAKGGLNVTVAEWSYGPAAAAAGTGTAMTGVFTTPTVDVSAVIPTRTIPPGPTQFWVRGRDSANNWGPATALQVQVNPGMFARADVLCAADTSACPGDTLNLVFQVVNIGPGADTLHAEITNVGPGPGLTLVGDPVVVDTTVAAGDTLSVPFTVVAAGNAADGATAAFKARAWPTDFVSDADSCLTVVTVMAPVVAASCPADTLVISPDTVPLDFAIANTGSKADSIRWTITDLGPGPDIVMQGGPSLTGVSYLGGTGPTTDNLPAVTVEAYAAATPGQTATIQLITWPDSDPSLADTCDVTIGVSMASAVPEGGIPLVFAAGPAHPNPFSATARISFTLPASGHAAIRIHAADGRLIRTLVDGDLPAGPHLVDWDGRDGEGTAVPSGVYFYRLTGDGGQVSGGRVLRVR